MKNDYVQQSSVSVMLTNLKWQDLAQRRTDERLSLMYKIGSNKICEATKKPQQILANKKYYEMSFFPCTVKNWNSLPKTLLATDTIKAFKAWVVSIEHHLPY